MCSKVMRGLSPLFFLSIICAASCTVKEDRDSCPCALRIQLEGWGRKAVSLRLSGENYLQELSSQGDTTLNLRVPKSGLGLLAVSGAGLPDGPYIRIPYGYDCPRILLAGTRASTRADSASLILSPLKHYCALTIHFSGPESWGEPFWAQIRGSVEGLYADGTPAPGPFSCRADDSQTVCLPRQRPSDILLLDIMMPGQPVRTFDLGGCLEMAGYDWEAPQLEDKSLEIELCVSSVTLHLDGWSRTIYLKVDI
ncbi:MAG: hypothetical protein J6T89_00970 [Bacteroidales bacterium]|nr:hypothetical protein [Bacteroidales bacterium]